jgi:hypothetical protein
LVDKTVVFDEVVDMERSDDDDDDDDDTGETIVSFRRQRRRLKKPGRFELLSLWRKPRPRGGVEWWLKRTAQKPRTPKQCSRIKSRLSMFARVQNLIVILVSTPPPDAGEDRRRHDGQFNY